MAFTAIFASAATRLKRFGRTAAAATRIARFLARRRGVSITVGTAP
jgi:hypothetical protein